VCFALLLCPFLPFFFLQGFFVGGSSGLNVCAAVRVARTLQPGSVVVTVLCDGGALYLDKHWGPNVLESLGLPPDAGSDLSFLS
jgi:cysteine synthase A